MIGVNVLIKGTTNGTMIRTLIGNYKLTGVSEKISSLHLFHTLGLSDTRNCYWKSICY